MEKLIDNKTRVLIPNPTVKLSIFNSCTVSNCPICGSSLTKNVERITRREKWEEADI